MEYVIKREFIYGWDYAEFSDDNGTDPVVYTSKSEAEESLKEYIDDVNEAYKEGHMDAPYEDDCKIVKVGGMEFSKQTIVFKDLDKEVKLEFTPTEEDYWTTIDNYDVNFDYELGSVNVYDTGQVVGSVMQSIHHQKITY
jgi:hypothetical protein